MEMGKKLRELAGGVSENQLASTVKESAQQIWLAGLGAFAKAQEEGGKVFDALVKEGESIQSKTRKMTDERIAQVAGKAAGTWDRLEQVFEDRVARALGSLGVPSKQDIDRLSKRVIELSAAVQALTEGKVAPKVVAKPAVKEAATTAEPGGRWRQSRLPLPPSRRLAGRRPKPLPPSRFLR
jgi:poly(hydroxyalkanoate) granule-associated protein